MGRLDGKTALIVVLLSSTLASCNADPPLSRIAIGSCAEQLRPQPIWGAIAASDPDLFIFDGDVVYGDLAPGPDGRPMFVRGGPAHLAAAYAALDRVVAFRNFRARFPILPIWDDHDLGENDAGGDYDHKEDSERQFLEFWNIPDDDPRARRPGLYRSWFFGPSGRRLQVVMLDTRFFRSPLRRNSDTSEGAWQNLPDTDPSKTMLGRAQWSWLREELRKPADVRLVVSSIQVIADGHGKERWGNFPRERDRLYELIAETRASGVILLSGDRHLAALYLKSSDVPYPLYELTSSSLNRTFADPTERGPYQLGETFGEDNFGTVDIDWTSRAATLTVLDVRGQVVRRVRVDLDELKVPDSAASSGA